jgi:hypothetical protein
MIASIFFMSDSPAGPSCKVSPDPRKLFPDLQS